MSMTFVMSAVLICKWTLSHYDDDDDDDEDGGRGHDEKHSTLYRAKTA